MPKEENITKTITCKNYWSEAVVKFGNYKGDLNESLSSRIYEKQKN